MMGPPGDPRVRGRAVQVVGSTLHHPPVLPTEEGSCRVLTGTGFQPSAGPSVGWEEGRAQAPGCTRVQGVHTDTAACTGCSERAAPSPSVLWFSSPSAVPHMSLWDKETRHLLLSVTFPRAREVLDSRHCRRVPGSGTA